MSIVVAGATGHLGRLAVESLLRREVPAAEIVAVGRDTARIADLADRGVRVVRASYDEPATLAPAFDGADKILLVSGNELGRRVPQHRNVVDAARAAGVALLAYTSIPHAATSSLILAQEHRATEELIAASGVPYTFLRNSWYFENYTGQIPAYLEHGVVGAAGDGAVSTAARADFADAAAAVLVTDGHAGRVYELGGAPITLSELAAEVARQTGRDVTYTDLPAEKLTEVLLTAGLPEEAAAVLVDADRGIAAGELLVEGDDLARLLGRAPVTLAEAVAAALADQG